MRAKILLIVFIILLAACTPKPPQSCVAKQRVDVYESIPSATNHPKAVDWLDQGQETIVTAEVDGWYEVVTPTFTEGYINSEICE